MGLSYLINPQSFLTSVNQVAAQKNQWELDKLVTFTDVTKWEDHSKVDAVSRVDDRPEQAQGDVLRHARAQYQRPLGGEGRLRQHVHVPGVQDRIPWSYFRLLREP